MKVPAARSLAAIAVVATAAVLPAQQPSPVKAFTGLRLIDGTDRAPVANATILVRDGRITAAGPASTVQVPADAERVALNGKTVIPGLINSHGHVNDIDHDLRTYAAYGVTTVYSLGNDSEPERFIAARDSQNTASLNRTRIFTAGPVLAPTSAEQARELVARNVAMKVDVIKIRVDPAFAVNGAKMPPETYRAVIDEAHKRNFRVAVHIVTLDDAKGVLDAGADFIAHSVRDRDVDPALIAALKSRGVCLCPTLMRDVSTYIYEATPAFLDDPFFLAHADAKTVATLKEPARQAELRTNATAQLGKKMYEIGSRNAKALSDAGVTLAMGTDTGPMGRFQGYFELMELDLLRKAGLTPRQTLEAATRDAAKCLKIDRDLGTIETGKWADFVALDRDPLADINNVRAIDSVWIAGNRVPR